MGNEESDDDDQNSTSKKEEKKQSIKKQGLGDAKVIAKVIQLVETKIKTMG